MLRPDLRLGRCGLRGRGRGAARHLRRRVLRASLGAGPAQGEGAAAHGRLDRRGRGLPAGHGEQGLRARRGGGGDAEPRHAHCRGALVRRTADQGVGQPDAGRAGLPYRAQGLLQHPPGEPRALGRGHEGRRRRGHARVRRQRRAPPDPPGRAQQQRAVGLGATPPGGAGEGRPAVLLAGRTPAIEWAALQLRRAGFEPRALERGDDPPPTAALLVDLDDEAWRGRDEEAARAAEAAGCPLVLLSSFGRQPGARPGSDLTVSAAAGLLHVTGTPSDPDQRPAVLSPQQADALAGSFAALWIGALALSGATSGVTELTKLECLAIATSWAAVQWLYTGVAPSRLGVSVYQPSRVFEAKDGPVYTIIVRDEQWARLRQAMGEPEWAGWEIFGSQQGRLDGVELLAPRIAEWLAQHTREEILDLSLRHRLPFALANRPDEAAALQEQLDGEPDHARWLYRTTPAPPGDAPPREALEARTARDPQRPLAGILVIDVSSVWATPYVGQLLGQLGARVIKVESRRRLDDVRPIMTYLDPHAEGETDWDRSGGFREVNRGKESVLLDLTTAEGRTLLHRLVARADVLLSNLTPGAERARRLGLHENQLWAANPGLVIGRLSAYQPGSQLEGMTGYGYGMLLMCGFGYAGPARPWRARSIAYPAP
ncbi:MAG: hypothetical protein F4Z96_06600, partial [Chloroflexi bacterium]|nr:hypothetical protein [Chloroflexota bacterium]